MRPDREFELFLLGALSLLDAMLDQPMSTVLQESPVSDDLKRAMQGAVSPLRPVLEFVERYERGDWKACAALASTLGVDEGEVLRHYNQATCWPPRHSLADMDRTWRVRDQTSVC